MVELFALAPGLQLKDKKELDITFPFKRLQHTDEQIWGMFNKLKAVDVLSRLEITDNAYIIRNLSFLDPTLKIKGPDGNDQKKYVLFIHHPADYSDFDYLSDLFNEEARMKARVMNMQCSPWQWWEQNKNRLLAQSSDVYQLREMVFNNCKECTTFRPLLVRLMIKIFQLGPDDWILDPSSGWGDRLEAAIADGIPYVGVDPNPEVHKGYQKIIDFFHADPQRYLVAVGQFEKIDLPPGRKYKLVITSPPYFKLETYTHNRDRTQSVVNYPSERLWYDNFLKVMMQKARSVLAPGGAIVIVINQCSEYEQYTKWLYKDFGPEATGEWAGMFMGIIGYCNSQHINIQPMWIWKDRKN